jgi:tRNA threonylcarbamoyladenosine biosynthesis protein TsaB
VNLILNIDTALETASICLAENGNAIAYSANHAQKDHAAWLHPAIIKLFSAQNIPIADIAAIAVSEGPGSYTGLRVGMATAKGLCYALNKPLITISTLKMMAFAARNEQTELLAPMIDARRMEVFTAIYSRSLTEILPASNLILEFNSFEEFINQHTITFFGSGSEKFKALMSHKNAIFKAIETNATHMVELSYEKEKQKIYADLAYSEPYYGKEFHSTVKHTL